MATYLRKNKSIAVTLQGECADIEHPKLDDGRAGSRQPVEISENLLQMFKEEGFDSFDSFELTPELNLAMRAGSAMDQSSKIAMIDIQLDKGDSALILTEEDGFYQWHTPAATLAKSSSEGQCNDTKFIISLVGQSSSDGRAGASPFNWLTSKVKVYVLKYVVEKTTEFIVNSFIEKKKDKFGPVLIKSDDPKTWVPVKKLPPIRLPEVRSPRILLLIHGTFSSTQGSFGALVDDSNGAGLHFYEQAQKNYDIVIGYDHKTLSETPKENAEQILEMLKSLDYPNPPVIDAIVYSRGGLVYRTLIEQLLPESGFDGEFNRVVFVGCTNSGTLLASYDNWMTLINIYTNIALGATKLAAKATGGSFGIFSTGIAILARFMKCLAQGIIKEKMVPGLAAMSPYSETVSSLNQISSLPDQAKHVQYSFVTCNFDPHKNQSNLSNRFVLWLADRAVDRLMQNRRNDLVVDTRSMTAIDLVDQGKVNNVYEFSPIQGVYHTVYFSQRETVEFIEEQLEMVSIRSTTGAVGIVSEATSAAADRILDVQPDRVDLRDWLYRPNLNPIPDELINIEKIPEVLDQGREGACTGFALAAVINYLLHQRQPKRRVSPHMLYDMARKYDEWPGESYEGSSARGAMKGWVSHGVCDRSEWVIKGRRLTQSIAWNAQEVPGGAYYRVTHKNIRDMHNAIAETGILFATLKVHAGWQNPSNTREIVYFSEGAKITRKIAVIQKDGPTHSGHAIAIVGYTREGFIIQNSWGEKWGTEGFALLPYEDYLMHAMDVWVAQLGAPIALSEWKDPVTGVKQTKSIAGLFRTAENIPLIEIRPHIINAGNNGRLSDKGKYWTDEQDLHELFHFTIPEKFKEMGWKKKRILLYLHGGLNSEDDVAKRVVAFNDKLLQNEIYPLHVMWETGFKDTLFQMIDDLFTSKDERAGGSFMDWINDFRFNMKEAVNETLERSLAGLGRKFWQEMKENAQLASFASDGAIMLAAQNVLSSLSRGGTLDQSKKNWEIHIVGHSAGSIFAAYAIPLMVSMKLNIKTVQFFAPAVSMELFARTLWPLIQARKCPTPLLYLLNKDAELADTVVKVYGHSLLYLVSNAFEEQKAMPLLGMVKFLEKKDYRWEVLNDIADKYDPAKSKHVIVSGTSPQCSSRSHGGFDNDDKTMNAMICRILNVKSLKEENEFKKEDLDY